MSTDPMAALEPLEGVSDNGSANLVVETSEVQDQELQSESLAQVMAQAREFGWKREDEWQGEPPPNGFLTPTDYLETSLVQAKIARKENADLRAQMKVQEERSADNAARTERMYQDAAERRREAHQREVNAIQDAQRTAAETGDMERYDALARQHAEMRVPEPATTVSPDVTAWQAKNTWFGSDPDATQYAQGVAGRVAQSGGNAAKQMVEVDRLMRQRFPEHFSGSNPVAPKPQRVDGGGLGHIKGKSIFDKLPPDAQRQAREDVAEGLYQTLDEYAVVYMEAFGDD